VRWVAIVAALVAAIAAWGRFLVWVEARHGVLLDDPLLARLPPVDLTWPIFALVYGGLASGLLLLLRTPRRLSVGALSYAFMVTLRIGCMWLLPLDPPPGMILLVDPMVRMAGVADPPTRDLFFSGHTATLCLVALAMPRGRLRVVFGALTVLMGLMVLAQHVHYAVDVLVAPMAAYVSHRLALRLHGDR
jgi:hypothetical protein